MEKILMANPYTYKQAAQDGYNNLVIQYKKSDIFAGNIWFGGNTLHTCLDFLIWSGQEDIPQNGKTFLESALDVFNDLKDPTDWWRDDYGWWGIAFMLALNARLKLGYDDSLVAKVQTALQSVCWTRFNANWRDTTYNHSVPIPGATSDNAVAAAPNILGGVFNDAPDSTNPPMSGRNSVTNELFWKLAQRMAGYFPTDPNYKVRVANATKWFQQWLSLPLGKGILNSQNLVLERPTGNKKAHDAGYDWYWSGDQGLMIEALPTNDPNRNNIVQSVIKNMVANGILHENVAGLLPGQVLHGFLADYATGKGIFMRNLVRFIAGNKPPQLVTFIKTNASAIWGNRDQSTNQFTFNWDRAAGYEPDPLRVNGKSDALCDLIMQASGQDALNAAMWIAPNDPI
jgi:hypothetical protein